MSKNSPDMLLEKYKVAVDLYKHEDNLNWQKLNHLIYITSGLLAAIGFIITSFFLKNNHTANCENELIQYICSGACFLGGIVSIIFGVALWYGIYYMNSRKDAAAEIEKTLVGSDEKNVVLFISDSGKKKFFLKRSPTALMLGILPIALLGVWIVLYRFLMKLTSC